MCSPEWSGGEAEGEEQQLEADLIAGFHDGPFVSIESFEDIPVAVRVHPFIDICIHLRALSVTTFPESPRPWIRIPTLTISGR